MPAELQKEIENHLATFPERHKDILEMTKEWKEFKSRALWILVGFIGTILSIGIWVGKMQTNIENNTTIIGQLKTDQIGVVSRLTSLEITNSEIKARLTSIDATLQEIKVSIRQIGQ